MGGVIGHIYLYAWHMFLGVLLLAVAGVLLWLLGLFNNIVSLVYVPEVLVRADIKPAVLSLVGMAESICVGREAQSEQNYVVVIKSPEARELIRGKNDIIALIAGETLGPWSYVHPSLWDVRHLTPKATFFLSYLAHVVGQEFSHCGSFDCGASFWDTEGSKDNVSKLLDGWRSSDVFESEIDMNAGVRSQLGTRKGWSLSDQVWPLVYLKKLLLIFETSLRSASTADSSINRPLHLMSSRNLFSPLANSHISVESNGKQSKPLNQEPYHVASFCTSIIAAALVFCVLCFMHHSDHFLWGGFLVVSGLCVFVYGLNGIFDFLEITTK